MSPLPYELDGHAQDDAERAGVTKIPAPINENWARYVAFQTALFDELAGDNWGLIDWKGYDKIDFKDVLRTAWEKSQNS